MNQPYQEQWAEFGREDEGHVQNLKVGKPWCILGGEKRGKGWGIGIGSCQAEEGLEVSFKLWTQARPHVLTGQCKECELESNDQCACGSGDRNRWIQNVVKNTLPILFSIVAAIFYISSNSALHILTNTRYFLGFGQWPS